MRLQGRSGTDQSYIGPLAPDRHSAAIPSQLGPPTSFSIYCLFELNSESLAVMHGFCTSPNPENENQKMLHLSAAPLA